jgi:pimeloyl-ACP methyl ester carboxylesterase
MVRRIRWLVLGFCVLACAACAGGVALRPDLERLYAKSKLTVDQPPVVVVHGVLGAKLRHRETGVEAWPGGVRRLAFSAFRDLALDIDPATLAPRRDALEPYAIFDTIVGQDFYGEILRTLEGPGGYVRGEPGRPPANHGKQYYVFLYDWRRDNIESVRALDALIERIRADYGKPGLRVDVVAHSNGGLISRYYARYGTKDLLDGNDFPVTQAGAAKIRRLVLLGTPNFGSVQSVIGLIDGSAVGLRKIPPEVLVTFPTAYQLLPHALHTWLVTPEGKELERDVFDVEVWRRFQWAIFDPKVRERVIARFPDRGAGEAHLALLERYMAKYLERARRFTWALSVAEPTRGVKPIVLGGDCELTPARLVVENVGDDSLLRLWPEQIANPVPGVDYDALMLEPGDGTVTKASLLARESVDPTVPRHEYSHFPLDYSFFLCERHDRLTGNVSFQDNLLHALLSVDR